MEKFTKGPWSVHPASTMSAQWEEIYSADMQTQICQMEMPLMVTIGSDTDGGNILAPTPYEEEAKANARLIAAAPEMYRLLKKVVDITDTVDNEIEAILSKINQ